jgi:hypothetical protein
MRGSQTHLQRVRAAGARRSDRPAHTGELGALETLSEKFSAARRQRSMEAAGQRRRHGVLGKRFT